MTAINVIVQPDLAYFLTDRAHYDQNGIVIAIGSKVVLAPSLRAAISYSGMIGGERIRRYLETSPPRGQAELLAALPKIAADLKAENVANAASLGLGDWDLQLFVVMWSLDRCRAEGYFTSTNRAYFGDNYEPGAVCQINSLIVPEVDLGPIDVSDPDQFMPEILGTKLVEEQRATPWIDDGKPGYFVGGGVDLTIVGAGGVRLIPMLTWPDKVGERIDPIKRDPAILPGASPHFHAA